MKILKLLHQLNKMTEMLIVKKYYSILYKKLHSL